MQWAKQSSIILGTATFTAILTYQFSLATEDKHMEVSQTAENTAPMVPTFQAECLPERASPTITAIQTRPPDTTSNEEAASALETKEVLEKKITQEIYERVDEKRRHMDAMRNFLSSHAGGNYNEALQQQYESEEINYDWALQKEDQIYQILNSSEALSYIAPLDVSCRSQNCQVVLPRNDQAQAKELFDSFLNATKASAVDGSPALTASYFSDLDSGELTFYISEAGNSSLFEQREN